MTTMIAKPLLAAKAGALCNCDVYLFVCLSVCCLKGNGHRVAATNGCPRCFLPMKNCTRAVPTPSPPVKFMHAVRAYSWCP